MLYLKTDSWMPIYMPTSFIHLLDIQGAAKCFHIYLEIKTFLAPPGPAGGWGWSAEPSADCLPLGLGQAPAGSP